MRDAGGKSEYTRLFINLGSVDEFNRGDLLGYICNNSKISGRTVGKIDVKGVYSFFEVSNGDVDQVVNNFKGVEFKGREVRIEISGEGTSTPVQVVAKDAKVVTKGAKAAAVSTATGKWWWRKPRRWF
jgi:ATP-dependent RNA helicase DeaD